MSDDYTYLTLCLKKGIADESMQRDAAYLLVELEDLVNHFHNIALAKTKKKMEAEAKLAKAVKIIVNYAEVYDHENGEIEDRAHCLFWGCVREIEELEKI